MRAILLSLALALGVFLVSPQSAGAQTVTIRPKAPFFQPVSPVWYPSFYQPPQIYYAPTFVAPNYGYYSGFGYPYPYVAPNPYLTYRYPAYPYVVPYGGYFYRIR